MMYSLRSLNLWVFIRLTVVLGLAFLGFSCVSIRVYVPGKFPIPKERLENLFFYEEIAPLHTDKVFARIDPMLFGLFYNKEYRNRFGGLQMIFSEELSRNKEIYFPNNLPLRFQVKKFELKSKDHCRRSYTTVVFEVDVTDNKGFNYSYSYEDKIESYLTDCNTILSSVTLFGLVWYLPYQGFRGDREDQLNQLGILAVQDFFEKFRTELKSKKQKRT